MSHRKVYKDSWGSIPKRWEIHHLDIDEENNEPDNLVAIPKSFHLKYHFARNFIKGATDIDRINSMAHYGNLKTYIRYLSNYEKLQNKMKQIIEIRNYCFDNKCFDEYQKLVEGIIE